MLLLHAAFREGNADALLISETTWLGLAARVVDFQRAGALPDLKKLDGIREHAARAEEFDRARASISGRTISGKIEELVARDCRVFVLGGTLVLAASTLNGRLFLATFDPVAAHGLLVAYGDSLEDQ